MIPVANETTHGPKRPDETMRQYLGRLGACTRQVKERLPELAVAGSEWMGPDLRGDGRCVCAIVIGEVVKDKVRVGCFTVGGWLTLVDCEPEKVADYLISWIGVMIMRAPGVLSVASMAWQAAHLGKDLRRPLSGSAFI